MDKVTSSQFNRNARITFVTHFAASHSIIVNETVSSIHYMMHHLSVRGVIIIIIIISPESR
jgi:hypothetical protein